MWADHVVPRLRDDGLGAEVASRTYRLAGIGESQVADLLGDAFLRATNPIVATYARVEAVDVRVSAVAEAGRSADELVEAAAAVVLGHLGDHVWATGETTWSQATRHAAGRARLDAGRRRDRDRRQPRRAARRRALAPLRRIDRVRVAGGPRMAHGGDDTHGGDDPHGSDELVAFARRARELGGADVGIAVRARPRTGDTAVSIAIVTPLGERRIRRLVFLTGPMGRSRAALAAAAVLLETLRDPSRDRLTAAAGSPTGARRRPVRAGPSPAIPSRSSRTSPSSENWPSSLFTLCRVQPTIEASSPWVSDERSRIEPSSAGGPGFLGEPDEAGRHAPGHVEEMELLDVDGEAPQLGRQRGQERVADRRFRRDQLAESVAWQDDGLRRREGRRRGRSGRAVEQRQLAEDVARAQGRDDRLVAGLGRKGDLHLARDEDEQGVAGVAGMEDDLASTEPAGPRPTRHPLEGIVVEPGEERDPGE